MRTILLDTETTGLGATKGDRIVEIACLEIAQRRVTDKRFQVYLNPERDMSEEAFAVHGLSAEFLADKPLFAVVANEFLSFIKGAQLIIHNAAFDVGFLNAELARIGAGDLTHHIDSVVDTLLMAKEQFPGKRNSLDALCQRFNISIAHRQIHGAMKDVELLAQVYFALTSGQQSLTMKEESTQQAVTLKVPQDLPVQEASADEQAAHAAILAQMAKKSTVIWQ